MECHLRVFTFRTQIILKPLFRPVFHLVLVLVLNVGVKRLNQITTMYSVAVIMLAHCEEYVYGEA